MSRWRVSEEGSLVMALLAAIVAGGLIVVLVARTQTSEQHVRFDRDYQLAINGADAGIQQALNVLGTLTPEQIAALPLVEGQREYCSEAQGLDTVIGDDRFDWCAALDEDSRAWAVTSTGVSADVQRTIELDIAPDPLWFVAAFGRVGVRMLGNNLAASYPPGSGAIGSNGWVSMAGNATADVVMLMGEDAFCAGDFDAQANTCNGVPVQGNPSKLDFPAMIDEVDERIAAECAPVADEADVPDHIAALNVPFDPAVHAPLQGGKTYCFTRFDTGNHADTKLTGADRFNPATVYVTEGPLSLGGHNTLACRGAGDQDLCNYPSATPDSGSLQIFTNIPEIRIGNQSKIAAAILAPKAACRGNPSGANYSIYGSIICHQLGQDNPGNQGGWSFYFDVNLLDVGGRDYRPQGYREEAPVTFPNGG